MSKPGILTTQASLKTVGVTLEGDELCLLAIIVNSLAVLSDTKPQFKGLIGLAIRTAGAHGGPWNQQDTP